MSDNKDQKDKDAHIQDATSGSIEETELSKLQKDLEELQSARLQLMADFDNYRKRMDNERTQFGVLTNMQLISQILDILDDIQLAINDRTQSEEGKHILQVVNDKMLSSLNSVGVHKVIVNQGDKYDAASMEAITTIPADQPDQHNTVAQVVSAAFRFNGEDKLLKTAKVIVFKHNQ